MSEAVEGDTVLYGIANCDSCRKARRWLDEQGVEYRFHDLRVDRLEVRVLEAWLDSLGWESLLNRRSRTWRELPPSRREGLDRQKAGDLLTEEPLLIKRPVLTLGNTVHAGFSTSDYARLFSR